MPRQPVEHQGFVNEKRGFVLQFLSKSEIKVSSVIPHLKRIVMDFRLICHTSTYDVIHGVTLRIIMYFMYFQKPKNDIIVSNLNTIDMKVVYMIHQWNRHLFCIHVLKLSEIIPKDGGTSATLSQQTPASEATQLFLPYLFCQRCICFLHTGATKCGLNTSGYHQNHYLYLTLLKKSNGHCTINRLQIYLKLWH